MSDIEGNRLYAKCLGCLAGGIIGDALGAPSEGKSPAEIEQQFGWLDDFESGGTDDTILRDILARSLIRTSVPGCGVARLLPALPIAAIGCARSCHVGRLRRSGHHPT